MNGAAEPTAPVVAVPKVRVERDGAVATITIDRPKVRNAIDYETAEQLAEAIDELDRDQHVRALVLTGAGASFSAGMDLKGFVDGRRPVIPGRGFAGFVERPPSKPIVAAVEGAAIGGGCELALACDLIVAGSGARFGLPEVKRGLTPAAGGLFRLPRRIPYHVAMELILTGEFVGASRAFELGLVNRLVDDGDALRTALVLASMIAANGPLAVATAKRVLVESVDWPLAECFARQEPLVDAVRRSADAAEGAKAFLEKRPPVWADASAAS